VLGEDVERVARDTDGLDLTRRHSLGDDRRLHEVATVLGEHDAARDGTDLVAGTADALQAGRDGRR
jgi:hypothetical protein